MNWIKENYDRFLLGLCALALLVCAGLLVNTARGFNEVFNDLRGTVAKSTKIPNQDIERFAKEGERIKNPDLWKTPQTEGRALPLFVSIPYIANPITNPDGTITEELIDPITDARPLHPPIPNAWFLDYKLDLLSQSALTEDPDGDGFSNLEEFNAKTDPTNKDAHPPYTTKLFLERFIQRPFRLRFEARNGEVVQINPLDVADAGSQFLRKGQQVQGTKFKVVDVKIQQGKNELGSVVDTSVVTLENVETKERIELPKEKDVDSPDSYARLAYVWGEGRRFDLKKNQEFSLKPEDGVKYRLVNVDNTAATILRVSDNTTFKIPPLSANTTGR